MFSLSCCDKKKKKKNKTVFSQSNNEKNSKQVFHWHQPLTKLYHPIFFCKQWQHTIYCKLNRTDLQQKNKQKTQWFTWSKKKMKRFLWSVHLFSPDTVTLWTSIPDDTWGTAAGPAGSSATSGCSACGNSESTDPRPAGSHLQELYSPDSSRWKPSCRCRSFHR